MKTFIILFLSLFGIGAIGAQATVDYVDGELWEISGSDEYLLDIGDYVEEGAVIETGPGSLAILTLGDFSEVKLRENTILELEGIHGDVLLSLQEGSVFSNVNPAAMRNFSVHTPYTVAGVRGTEFFIGYGRTVEENPDIWLCVNEGTVAVSLIGDEEEVLVNEGEGINILAGNRITDPQYFPWTEELNWNTDPSAGSVQDDTDLDGAYADLLDQDYL